MRRHGRRHHHDPHHEPEHDSGHEHRGRRGSRRGHRGSSRGGGRGRARRGDVRAALLLLLAEGPMHGYQLMQTITERTNGSWRPSPGVVYPTLSQLADEGLITLVSASGRNLAILTDEGRDHLAANASVIGDPFAEMADEDGVDLRDAVEQIHEAARAVTRDGSPERLADAQRILAQTRTALYLLLAKNDDTDDDTGDDTPATTSKDMEDQPDA